MHKILTIVVLAVLVACGERDRQNSAFCGLTFMAGANRVLDQMANVHAILRTPPEALKAGLVPTRVVGYPASRSTARMSGDSVVLGFDGEGLPSTPGFGLALVDDSSEVFRGVLIFETGPPQYPELGSIVGSTHTVPLFGLRIHWTSVNSDQCPLFPPLDSATSA